MTIFGIAAPLYLFSQPNVTPSTVDADTWLATFLIFFVALSWPMIAIYSWYLRSSTTAF